MRDELLRMERLTYIREGVTLLENFNLNIYRGEILGLLCVNDNGLESLLELLAENKPIHFGRVYFHEHLVNNHLHSNYSRNSVGVIEKRSSLVGQLTVADNVFVLRDGFKKHVIRSKSFEEQFRMLCRDHNLSISAGSYVDRLTTFERCMVELIKAVATGIRLIVIRDVSNFIGTVDLERLHKAIRFYAKRGIAFLYVCNHHEEIYRICDRTAMMENGRIIRILNKDDMTDDSMDPSMRPMMKTNRVAAGPDAGAPDTGRMPVLEFRDVSTETMDKMRFCVYPGECVVLLDINNTTQGDFLQLLFGQARPAAGSIWLEGARLRTAAQRRKVALIREKPAQSMLFPDISYLDNLCFMADRRIKRVWSSRRIRQSIIKEYYPSIGPDIFAADLTRLSAKALYNLIYQRTVFQRPLAAVCVQPFSGADFYLRLYVIKKMRKLLEHGIAVVILAVSLSDSLQLADRLLVIKEGCICMEYGKSEISAFKSNAGGLAETADPGRN